MAGGIVYRDSVDTYEDPEHGVYYEQDGANRITKYEFGYNEILGYTYRYFNSGGGSQITSVDNLFNTNSANSICIVDADICLNVSYPFGTASTSYHPQAVITHEIGHLLGFGHSSDSNAIMYEYIPPGYNKGVADDDFDARENIYGR